MIRLFELRSEKGLSQREMAAAFGISQGTYNNWEKANTQPSIEQLIQLAKFFEVSVDYLIGNSDDAGAVTYVAPLSPEQRDMVELCSSLPQNVRTAAMTMMRAAANK